MHIEQLYTSCLAQASYFIRSGQEAAVIDPMRDVEPYLSLARANKATIRYIFLTHFHADFVSGHLDLALQTGATIVFGPRATPGYAAVIAQHKQRFALGNVQVEVLHTPGHTIESSCFLLLDEQGKPHAVFTGDTLFVGDAGRPDLLSGGLSREELAAMLYESLQSSIKTLPDEVILYPGHGEGSACGKNLGKERYSTIGEQKRSNYALGPLRKEEFIRLITADQPPAPAYFARDARINMSGYPVLNEVLFESMQALRPAAFRDAMKKGANVLDTRSPAAFSKGFLPGAVNIGIDGQLAIWAGTLLSLDRPLLLVCEPGREKEAITRLARVGFANVVGYLDGGFPSWEQERYPVDQVPTVALADLEGHIPYLLLDVRKKNETAKEKLKGALAIPLDELQERMGELDPALNYAVCCVSGYRSMIASSLLKQHGFGHIYNVAGGTNALRLKQPELLSAL